MILAIIEIILGVGLLFFGMYQGSRSGGVKAVGWTTISVAGLVCVWLGVLGITVPDFFKGFWG